MNDKLQEEITELARYRASGLTAEECINIGRAIYRNNLTAEKLILFIERWAKKKWELQNK